MHPWDHARSSARRHGGTVEGYLPFHHWFDATKIVRAHFTHRALRHHHEGIAEAVRLFGDCLSAADGISVETNTLGRQHLLEDLGRDDVTAADWLQTIESPQRTEPVPTAATLSQESARRFGGNPSAYLPLHAWFFETETWFGDSRHLVMRHHAFGIFEAEARLGPVMRPAGTHPVPTRIVAERHVRTVMGAIPSADALLRTLRPARWMAAATSPRRLGLDS
jgi:hypothetical protein